MANDEKVHSHFFKKGDRVAIFAMLLSRRYIFEGYAVIQKRLDTAHHYRVVFQHPRGHSDYGDKTTYDRFVLLAGQDDPDAHVEHLNRQHETADR